MLYCLLFAHLNKLLALPALLTPFAFVSLTSDKNIMSDLHSVMAAIFMSKLKLNPVKLSEFRFWHDTGTRSDSTRSLTSPVAAKSLQGAMYSLCTRVTNNFSSVTNLSRCAAKLAAAHIRLECLMFPKKAIYYSEKEWHPFVKVGAVDYKKVWSEIYFWNILINTQWRHDTQKL